jgi:endonuclease YncB( thermonuclease family)
MRRWLILPLLILLASPALAQSAFTGRVVRVYDGDNARIERTLKNGRVEVKNYRIIGIDAPERASRQPYWQQSQLQLSQLILGKDVTVEVRGRDTVWKRPLAVIKINGVDAGLEQVKNGAAWYLPLYGRSLTAEEKAEYLKAYSESRAAKRGLWASPSPIEPRIWRKRMRAQRSN